jgi:putative inorganic carbon (HCO3(-)) transporter
MDPAFAVVHGASKAGVVAAALVAAAALIDGDARRRVTWMLGALTLAAVILVQHISDTEQFRSISGNTAKVGLLIAGGAAVIAGLTVLLTQRPEFLPPLVVAALPFRIPIQAAGTTANLLVPLYVVIAGGCAALAWRRLRTRGTAPETAGHPPPAAGPQPRTLQLALAAYVVLYALQSLYSKDFDTALEQIVFFLIPFAVLFSLLREVRWNRAVLVRCLGVALTLALAFVAIGFWEYQRRELLWNPKVIAANQFESYFRVNSVFWDPNIYGRFLVLVMLGLAAAMLWSARARVSMALGGALAVLWAGLVLTFSQSSFAALLTGLIVLAALRWDVRRTAAAAAIGLAAAVVFVLAFQSTLKIDLGNSAGLSKVTSGRSDLIQGGVELFGNRPLQGYGSGSFGRAFRRERKGNQQQAVSASHTLPVTVAAEQGVIGLAVYAAVLAAAFLTLFGNRRIRVAPGAAGVVARAAVAAMFCALVLHTMVYAAFLEDPFTWVILAIGLAVAPSARLAVVRSAPRTAAQPAPASA